MEILDVKTGEVVDKDISRSDCPFRSISDLKRNDYKSGEYYEPDSTMTQAEQYVPIIKMIEKMLRGEDVEFIKELIGPSSPSPIPDVNDKSVEDALDGVIPNDADPVDFLYQPDLSTETRASDAPNEQEQANSSRGEVADDKKDNTSDKLD